MLFIRADGNTTIGMGHIMRCLSIADAARKEGMEVCFLIADESPLPKIEEWGFEAKVLGTDYQQMEQELPLLIREVTSTDKKNVLLVDSYYVTVPYFEKLRETVFCCYIDDLLQNVYPVDAVINYNIYAEDLPYFNKYANTQLLLGSRYVPLREEFRDKSITIRSEVKNTLFTTGGGDACHMTVTFLEEYSRYHQLENIKKISGNAPHGSESILHIVCGPFMTDCERIRRLADSMPDVRVHENVKDMGKLLQSCDLVLAAAGSTLYELCAMGIPTITFAVADNQKMALKAFEERVGMPAAGEYHKNPEQTKQECYHLIIEMASKEKREQLQKRMLSVVDARGAERIACWIKEQSERKNIIE